MFGVAGGIIIAVVVLAIFGNAARYLGKNKAARRELTGAIKENREMHEFLADAERFRRWKASQFACQGLASGYVDDKRSGIPEVSNEADERLEGFIQKVLVDADALKDEYCKSAIFHSLSELMCKAGQFERATKLTESITVNPIREKALAAIAEEKKK